MFSVASSSAYWQNIKLQLSYLNFDVADAPLIYNAQPKTYNLSETKVLLIEKKYHNHNKILGQ